MSFAYLLEKDMRGENLYEGFIFQSPREQRTILQKV